jgi:type I restriction enzyme S subunit
MGNWKTCTIADLGTVVGGATPSTKKPENYEGGTIAWITPKDLAGFSGRFISHGERDITEIGLNSCSAQMMPKHSVLFSSRAPIGYVAIAENEVCTNQGFKSVVPNEKTDYMFLYYLLLNNRQNIEHMGSGTTFKEVSGETMRGIEVQVPESKEEQIRIASTLSALDDKIEENERINKNLLQQMESLYKAWFTDFIPFGGSRPSDWRKSDIYSIADIIYGAPFSSKLFNTDGKGIPIIRIRDLRDQAFVTYTTENHPKGHLIQPGDIVVGMDGEFRPYIWGNTEAWLNQRVCIFNNKRPKGKAFVLFTIKPLLYRIEQTQVATTVIHIGKKDYDAFELYLPDSNTLDQFDELTSPMIDQIVVNCLENKNLATLRDSLLPRLMSGELDVSDIDL